MPERFQRRINGEILGRISGGAKTAFHQERESEILSVLDPANEIREASDDRSDLNFVGEEVSIESAAESTLALQTALDNEVIMENLGITHHDKRSLPPCLRVKKDD